MKRSFVIYQNFLEKLAEDDRIENIILGTGMLARDLQAKLRLLNLKAPFLVGGRDDPANGIWHYERLAGLENPERYRFIVCFDVDEWTLIAPAQSAVFKLLGIATYNHPRMIRMSSDTAIYEKAGDLFTDVMIHNLILKDSRPYALFGEPGHSALRVHVFGGSCAASIFSYSQHSWPELLHDTLRDAGFNTVVYSWAQPLESSSDCLLQFLRDGYAYKPDLVILYKGSAEFDAMPMGKRNLLPVRTGVRAHIYAKQIQNTYREEISDGPGHEASVTDIWAMQHRIFKALSKHFGFELWSIIPPSGTLLPGEQSERLLGLSTGYLERTRRRKNEAVSAVGRGDVKDYTDSFIGVNNIFEMYADITHLTDEGNRIIAERCAGEILAAFGDK